MRDFWSYLPDPAGGRELSVAELTAALARWLAATRPGGLEWDEVQARLDDGTTLMIIDGVDEVPLSRGEDGRASSPRQMLLSALAMAAPEWIDQGNRLLLTSRPYGLSDREAQKLEMLQAPIADLDANMQKLLVRRWFHILADHVSAAEATARDMIDHIRQRGGLESLASNPLLLTAMCVVFSEGKRLPQDKYDLYGRIVDNVLYSRYPKDPAVIDLVRSRLNFIAYGMHTGVGLGEERASPQPATFARADHRVRSFPKHRSDFVGLRVLLPST